MKKWYAAALIMITASLTACGGTGKDNSQKSEGKKETVTVWAWDKEFNIAALEMAKEIYEKDHPDVNIELVEIGQDDVIQKLNTGLGSGSLKGLPNIVPIEDYRIQTFLRSYPGSFIEMTDKINYNDFAAYKQEPMKLDGKSYGIPWDNGAAVLYYRIDMIEKAGYTEADMEALTWSEFIEMGKKIKEVTGVNAITLDPNDIDLIKMILQSAGVWYTKEDGITPYLQDNGALRECLTIIKTMIDDDIVRIHSGWANMLEGMNNGEIAFQLKGCWFTPSVMKAEDQSGLWRVTQIPRLDTVDTAVNSTNLGGGSWYVLNGIENSDIALDFLISTFGTDKELYNKLLDEKGIMGTYLPSLESDIYEKELPFFGNQKVYQKIAGITTDIPKVSYGIYTYAFQDIITAEVQNLLQGTSIDDVLKNIQAQAEAQVR